MSQVLLRKTHAATVSVEDAVALVETAGQGKILHRSGDNVLADLDAGSVDALRRQLTGWIVSPQGERIPVPDTRRQIS